VTPLRTADEILGNPADRSGAAALAARGSVVAEQPMKPFVVNVADLLHRPAARRRERLRGRLDGLRVSGSEVPPSAPVDVDTLLEWVSDGILATGTVSAPWRGECRRCLVPADGILAVAFRELFESKPTDGESYQLRYDVVDLEPLVREAILLELPLAPLCREDCPGLCPTCGADLNEGPCACRPDDRDPRWAALDLLRGDVGADPEEGAARDPVRLSAHGRPQEEDVEGEEP
jgi:uncharacterized protein